MAPRLTFESDATPDPSVTALPTLFPLRLKATVLLPSGETPSVRVAERLTVPPCVPVAELTARVVGTVLSKQTETSFKVGVTLLLVVARRARYSK